MTAEWTPEEERDHFLVVTTVIAAASEYLKGYQGWLEAELKELINKIDVRSPLYDGESRRRLEARAERLRDIHLRDLPGVIETMKKRITEISRGAYDDVVEARYYLEGMLMRFEYLVRECLDARRLLDDLAFDDDDDPDLSPDEHTPAN